MGKSVPDRRKGNTAYRKGVAWNTPRCKLREKYHTVGNEIIEIQSTFLRNHMSENTVLRQTVGTFINPHTLVEELSRLSVPSVHKKMEIIDKALTVAMDLRREMNLSSTNSDPMRFATDLNILLSQL